MEIRVCFYEPWRLRSSFSFLWPHDSVFPCYAQKALEQRPCPWLWVGEVTFLWQARPLRPSSASPCAQREEPRAGRSPGHTAPPSWPLTAKSPRCFLWCPGRSCHGRPGRPQCRAHLGALWWQLGLCSVLLPPSWDEPGSVREGGVSFTPWSGSKGQ